MPTTGSNATGVTGKEASIAWTAICKSFNRKRRNTAERSRRRRKRMVERANPTQTAERELVIRRVFDAPRELVWKPWTNGHLVIKRLDPKRFTAPHSALAPRPGAAGTPACAGPTAPGTR